MSRLPFDPGKMAAAERAARPSPADPSPTGARSSPASPETRLSVSQAARLIDAALKEGMPPEVRVLGEISNFADRTHWYFQMKDEEAVLGCVMFAGAARKCPFTPADGQEIVATGRIEHYARQGRTQLYVRALEPVGAGALELRFRALCDELRKLGWFEQERKRPLPTLPRRVAVVTSRTGAAVQDVLDTLRRRCAAIDPVIVDVRVQGERAAPEVAAAIDRLSEAHQRLWIDALLVTRGGGSIEDLWAFNERDVARAILDCAIPVVAAIGHETDVTIAELVADVRAATPTQAAMRLAPDAEALLEQLDEGARRLSHASARRLREQRDRLARLSRRRVMVEPARLTAPRLERLEERRRRLLASARHTLGERRLRLERLSARLAERRPQRVYAARAAALNEADERLQRAIGARLRVFDAPGAERRLRRAWRVSATLRGERLDARARALSIAGPMSVLNRGFSITLRADGQAVRTPSDVRAGEVIETRLADGSFRSVVGDGERSEARTRAPGRPRTADRDSPRKPDSGAERATTDQMDLFSE